ncbi:MAG: HD domain-containing protein [Deltaproteobacteria bacterium]|nr:MAG: HD domain-containing protein [Deltaproteobacteria bacterium]
MPEKDDIQSFSTDIINSLAIILRTAELHDSSNAAVISQMEKMVSYINQAISDAGSFRITLVGDFFFENNARIKYPLKYHLHFDLLAAKFKQRNLGSIIFKDDIALEDIKTFLDAFIAAGNSETPFEIIHDAVSNLATLDVETLKTGMKEEGSAPEQLRRVIKKTYFSAVSLSKGVMDKMKTKEGVSLKKTRRIVQTLVDFISEDEQFLIGMTAIKNYDEYTYHHSVNVSILALALGQRLGLNKKELTELGIVAFFHDSGKVELPSGLLNKTSSFSDEEFALVKKHSTFGVKTLLHLKDIDPLVIRSAITAFEHHLNCDCSGYPRVKMSFALDIYSEIISIADRYDAMTSARVYRNKALPPDTALGILLKDSGSKIGPVMLNFFIMMVGIFPIGTLVFLNTKELGLVCEGNAGFIDRPKVRIIVDGNGLKKNYLVDLSERTSDGQFKKSIIKRLDPNMYDINLAEYLM